MPVGRICSRIVHLADIDESAATAARRMAEKEVGTLIIVNEVKYPVGIVTDRDLTTRVLAKNRDARKTRLATIMTATPKTVRETTPIEQALALMRAGGFRRLPVVDDAGKLIGILSMDDVLELLAEELQQIGGLLRGKKTALGAAGRPRALLTRAGTTRE